MSRQRDFWEPAVLGRFHRTRVEGRRAILASRRTPHLVYPGTPFRPARQELGRQEGNPNPIGRMKWGRFPL